MDEQDEQKDKNKLAHLSKAEIGTIIALIVQLEGRLELVKQDFHRIYNRRIRVEVLKYIQEKYADKIIKLAEKLISDGTDNPLLDYRFRSKMAWRIFKDAGEVRVRGWKKTGKDEVKEIKEWDVKQMIACLELVDRMDTNMRNWELARTKRGEPTMNLTGGNKKEPEQNPSALDDDIEAHSNEDDDDLVNFDDLEEGAG